MSRYETIGGVVTRGEAYSKLIHHMEEAANQAAVLAHLHRTEGNKMDDLLATGWLGIHELLLRMKTQITKMAMKKLQ